METLVTFRHVDASDAIKSYAEEKVSRIKKYLMDPIDVHIILSVEKIRHTAEVTIVTNGITINAEETTQDMYSAIDMVMDKIERQVRRYKEKIKSKKVNSNTKKLGMRMQIFSAESFDTDESKPKIIKERNFFAKPMSIDEAVMQMDLLHDDLLVFTNAQSDEINIIHRRKDGNYGLIEPHVG